MARAKGCEFPDELFYNVDNNVWVRREADGTVTLGMTAYAAALAGQIVSCTPKKVGRGVDKDKSAATVESGKWVGPVKSPVAGEVVAATAVGAWLPLAPTVTVTVAVAVAPELSVTVRRATKAPAAL